MSCELGEGGLMGGEDGRVLTLPWTRDDADAQHRGVLALQGGNGEMGKGGRTIASWEGATAGVRCAVCCVSDISPR